MASIILRKCRRWGKREGRNRCGRRRVQFGCCQGSSHPCKLHEHFRPRSPESIRINFLQTLPTPHSCHFRGHRQRFSDPDLQGAMIRTRRTRFATDAILENEKNALRPHALICCATLACIMGHHTHSDVEVRRDGDDIYRMAVGNVGSHSAGVGALHPMSSGDVVEECAFRIADMLVASFHLLCMDVATPRPDLRVSQCAARSPAPHELLQFQTTVSDLLEEVLLLSYRFFPPNRGRVEDADRGRRHLGTMLDAEPEDTRAGLLGTWKLCPQ